MRHNPSPSSQIRRLTRLSLVFLFLTLILFSSSVFAGWTERTVAGSRDWNSIASSSDGTKLVACVNEGYIYTSTDSGVTWTERTSSGFRDWKHITSSSDGTKLAAMEGSGYVHTSADSGATWTERTASGSRYWRTIASSADGSVIIAGTNVGGGLSVSTDSGVTWAFESIAGTGFFVESSDDGTKLTAAINNTSVYTSADTGSTWTQRDSSSGWLEIAASSDSVKLAATASWNYVYTSSDSGVTWTQRTTGLPSAYWRTIASSSDGTTLIVGPSNNYLYTSTDSGLTWTQQTDAGSRNKWYSTASSSDGKKLAATHYGGYIYTFVNDAPTVSSVSISGTANRGQLLTGNYTYADANGDTEGVSTYRWLRDDVAISGATAQTYTTVEADVGTTLKFEVTPVAATGELLGIAVESSGTAIANVVPSDIALSSQSVDSNSPSGTIVGTISATDADAGATFTFTLSSGAGCTASDNTKFTISGTDLKMAASTDFYTTSSYTTCIQVADQYNDTYRENFTILVPVPETVAVSSSSTGESTLPDVPRIILDEEKTVDLSAATASVSGGDRDVRIGGTNFNLEAYTAGALSATNVKDTAGISIQQATRITTSQDNLILSHTETADVELQIPDQTVVFGDDDADFVIKPPTDISNTEVLSIPSGFGVGKAVSVGSTTETYVFDTSVLLAFDTTYDRMLMRTSGSSVWESISQCLGTFASPTLPTFPDACWIGSQALRKTHVHTFHLTDFSGLLANNYGSGKQALFREGMQRSDIRQSGYGTDKKTFTDSYALSLAEAKTQNQGKSGISQFITTTWNNNKFLRYISGRMSVSRQQSLVVQPVKYRIARSRRGRGSDIELVLKHRNNKAFLASAPRTPLLKEEFKRIAKLFRPKGVRRNTSRQPKTRASIKKIEMANRTLRTRAIRDQQKAKELSLKNNYSSASKIEKPLSRIQQSQVERSERIRITMTRPKNKGVLRHLQNNLFLFSDFLKTSLFEMADMLSTSLFKVWN